MTRLPYKVLYILWAALFAVTAALGFVPPTDKSTEVMYQLLAGAFFLPPWMILLKSRNEDAPKHRSLIKFLCFASLGGTMALMALNILSANWSDAVGTALNAALTVVSAPMVCGQGYFLGLFMWGCLLMGANSRQ